MDKPTEKLDRGQLHTISIPLSSTNDIKLILIFKERNWHRIEDSRRYLIATKISYNKKDILTNIVELNRFISSIKAYVDRKSYFIHSDIYFTPCEKDGIKNIQCNFAPDIYIGMVEAMQINRTLQDAFWGFSKIHLFDEFTTDITDFMTKEEAKKYPQHMLENIKIIKG